MTGLGLDAGGSATRWALCGADGTKIAAGEVPSLSGLLFSDTAVAALHAATGALREALAGLPAPSCVVAGITGLSAGSAEAATAAGAIAASLGLPPDAVRVEEDSWIAYHACFARGAGHMVYAGTGSAGLHVRADGGTVRVGGRGTLIDDGGSAFWIGREALSLVWRRRDADPHWTSPLAGALDAAIGDPGWEAARAYVYGGGRTAVAMLARAVAASADADALDILARAGAELARLARALAARAGPKPVMLTGRAASLHPVILKAMAAEAPLLDIACGTADSALAAARLAVSARF